MKFKMEIQIVRIMIIVLMHLGVKFYNQESGPDTPIMIQQIAMKGILVSWVVNVAKKVYFWHLRLESLHSSLMTFLGAFHKLHLQFSEILDHPPN